MQINNDEEKILNLINIKRYSNYEEIIIRMNEFRKKYGNNSVKIKEIEKQFLAVFQNYFQKRKIALNLYLKSDNELKDLIITDEASLESKLKKVVEIYESEISIYDKINQISAIYKTSTKLFKEYADFWYFMPDDQFIKKIHEVYLFFNKCEKEQIVTKINKLFVSLNYYQNYDYAEFIINKFIVFKEPRLIMFLSEMGIDKEIFDFCVKTIEELDFDLNRKYLQKKEENEEIVIQNLREVASRIKDSQNDYDIIDFWQKIPFTEYRDFASRLLKFIQKILADDYVIFADFMKKNGINIKSGTKINETYLKNEQIKITVDNVEITSAMVDEIFKYMKQNNLPFLEKVYVLIRRKYLNNELNLNTDNLALHKTLIPSKKSSK